MRILYTYLMEIINYRKPQIIYNAVLIKNKKQKTNFQLLFPKELQKLS